jgi:hypothetical protein
MSPWKAGCEPLVTPSCAHHHVGNPLGILLPGVGHAAAHLAGTLVASAAGDALQGLADSVKAGVADVTSWVADWWVTIGSPDLSAQPAVASLHAWLLPVSVATAMVAMLISAGKVVLSRKAAPLIEVASGLVAIGAVTALGVVLPDLLLQWGDGFCDWVLPLAANGDFGRRMSVMLAAGWGLSPLLTVLLGFVVLAVSLIQAILLLFRQDALIILAGVLPLAASGTLMSATRPWLKKITGWMLTLIFYKPCAAMVYATAFVLIGQGRDARAFLSGVTMMVIALVAFPVLLKFFNWTTGGSESGMGGSFLGAVIGGATAIGALRSYGSSSGGSSSGGGSGGSSGGGSGGSSAGDHAGFLDGQLGSPQQTPPGPQGDGPQGGKLPPDNNPDNNKEPDHAAGTALDVEREV